MREKCDGGVVMAHGLEGGVERERPGPVLAMASEVRFINKNGKKFNLALIENKITYSFNNQQTINN